MLCLKVHHTLSLLVVLLAACGDSSYSTKFAAGPLVPVKEGQNSGLPNEPKIPGDQRNIPGITKMNSNGEFFYQPGKSLDLYVIMDKSLSLFGDTVIEPMSRKSVWVQGTDEKCQRFDALLDLIDTLRSKLTNNESVRTTIVSFNTSSSHLGTMDDTLSNSRDDIRNHFFEGVCGRESRVTMNGTDYVKGIEKAIEMKKMQGLKKTLEMQSVIFFSDGAANLGTEETLRAAISLLNQNFQARVWGFILGRASEKCILKKAGGEAMTAEECMQMIVDADSRKLVQVENASELSKGIIHLISR